LPKNRRYFFCDTLRPHSFSTVAPAFFTRHAAVWCSDFPPAGQKRPTSDHLPSSSSLSQLRSEGKKTADCADETAAKSKRGWHGDEENYDHHERDHEFAEHCTEISEQTSPTSPAGVDHSFASNEFTQNCSDYRPDKQSDNSKKDADDRANNGTEHSPSCGSEISRTKVAAEKIERVRRQSQKHKDGNRSPTDTFLRAKHHPMKKRSRENDYCPRKHRQHRANQADREQDNCDRPPKEFHGTQ
jgi:hypothetical protein